MAALLVLVVSVLVLAPLGLALLALARSGAVAGLEKRIAHLEDDLADLRKRFRALQRGERPEPRVEPPPEPEPAPAPPAPTPPPPTPTAPPPPPAPAAPPKPAIEWERWIGIRGAAVLGGIALALAGLLFFQYSIQHGLISRPMRVALGLVVGAGSVAGSEWILRRGYKAAAEGLAGAGVVVLYAAIWAAGALYGLVPVWIAFVLMAVVTATCGAIAVRREAPVVAVLGLVGGFATPLLLSLERDRPIGLFGYILLLDIGLIAVGRQRRWPWIGLLGLGGTAVLEVLWLGARLDTVGAVTALGILFAFAILFAASGFSTRGEEETGWRAVQAGGVLLPFFFAIYFASRVELGPHAWSVGLFAAALGAGASWSGRRIGLPGLGFAAAVGGVTTLAVWLLRAPATPGIAWEASAIACGLALVYHVFLEREGRTSGLEGGAPAAVFSAGASLLVLLVASTISPKVPPWPWLAGWLVLGALLVRQAGLTGLAVVQPAAAAGVAIALSLQHVVHFAGPSFPRGTTVVAAMLGVAALAQLVPFLRRDEALRRSAGHGAALAAAILSLSLLASPLISRLPTELGLGAPLLFGVLILLVATRLGEGEWSLAAVLITSVVHARWTMGRPHEAMASVAPAGIAMMYATAALFIAWPFIARGRLAASRWAWWAAAAAGPLWFFPIKLLWEVWRGRGELGLVPLSLGALALAGSFGARRAGAVPPEPRRSALVGFSAVAISFASVAIALQLHKSWITVAWALEGAALAWLWRRLDHPGLKWFAVGHLGAAAVRLVPTAVLLGSYPRSGTPILNWLLYTYLVPAAAMFVAARLLARDEVARARPFEKGLYAAGHPTGAIAASLGGIFTIFVWINLAIADWFSEGPRVTLELGREPARNLTMSIAWALYALVLLGIGMARRQLGLRWLSLGFLLVTIAKVFLYDLGELRDLYRVLSLVGLALSLLLVSVLYQRFVFRRPGGNAT